jgi:two-component system NarL family sensor kinase
VSNIIRHAHATEAVIDVNESANRFQIVIRDNGQGFNPDLPLEHDGLGLSNILQRARIYGGEVVVDSTPGGGTRLTLTLPI